MAKRVLIGFGVDVDVVAGWLGSYGGKNSPLDISRGMFAGEVGVPRLLKLFENYKIKTTWFIPGHSLETFPEQIAAVRDAGHEIGLHGYSHENPVALSAQQRKDILDHTYDLLTAFNNGIPPKGSVAPWREVCKDGVQVLLDRGIEYGLLLFESHDVSECRKIADHSGIAYDSQAYYFRDEDTSTKINYSADAKSWMKPLERGKETGLVCIPGNWYPDDLLLRVFMKSSSSSQGWVNPRDLEEIWKDMFTYCYNNEEEFIFPITIHPDVSGRPHVLLMLERFIQSINTHDNVHWVPMSEMAQEFRRKNNPAPGAQIPNGYKDSILLNGKL